MGLILCGYLCDWMGAVEDNYVTEYEHNVGWYDVDNWLW